MLDSFFDILKVVGTPFASLTTGNARDMLSNAIGENIFHDDACGAKWNKAAASVFGGNQAPRRQVE